MATGQKQYKIATRKKIESVVHVFLIGLAVFGCVLNVRRLCERKKEVVAENIEIFRKGYTTAIDEVITNILPKKNSIDLSFLIGVEKVNEILLQQVEGILITSYDYIDQVQTPQEQTETRATALSLVEKLLEEKIKNPFLFGFKDIGAEVSEVLDAFYKNKRLGDGFRNTQIIRLEIENFFRGNLTPQYNIMVFDMFYFLMLYSDKSTGISPVNLNLNIFNKQEYIITMCYLGEIVTRILGDKVEAMEFKPESVRLSQEDFSKSEIRKVLSTIRAFNSE